MNLWTIPNLLTYLRIILIPIFVVVSYMSFPGHELVVTLIFFVAALTDWFDGYLARYLKQMSAFGEFLDPVADKLMVAAALVLLVSSYPHVWMAIPGVVIISREIVISALREWMAELGQRTSVKVSHIGKVKTAAQMAAVLILLYQAPKLNTVTYIGLALLYVAVILTLWSMMIYLAAAWKILRHEVVDR